MGHARSNPQYKSFKTKYHDISSGKRHICITIMNYETNVLNEPSGIH
jgi:hypothetical protein